MRRNGTAAAPRTVRLVSLAHESSLFFVRSWCATLAYRPVPGPQRAKEGGTMTVVDVHTHMLTLDWIELLHSAAAGNTR